MSTQGVVDIVFCLDASNSMKPCIQGIRDNIISFLSGLGYTSSQRRIDWRVDYLAHSADEKGGVYRAENLRSGGLDLCDNLYKSRDPSKFFTSDIAEFQRGLDNVTVGGDEATLFALDTALDFPWRPLNTCHRVVVCLTDEPFEEGTDQSLQLAKLPQLVEKIQKLGVMLFIVAPDSAAFSRLAEVDKSEYETVDTVGDGLRHVAFDKVLAHIGKSVSIATLSRSDDSGVTRALYGQNLMGATNQEIRGR
jgi:hypothetical protein